MSEIVLRAKEFGLEFDHNEHNVLYNAAKDIVGVDGIVCEVGLRQGGGMGVMMIGCMDTDNTKRPFIAIDPYGNLIYSSMEGARVRFDYTNQMKYDTMIKLYKLAMEKNILFDLICLEDTEFFEKYKDGVPIYDIDKTMYTNYALVHLDGPHSLSEVMAEVDFFMDRISIGGYIVFDDVTYYDLSQIQNKLLTNNKFQLIENDGKKASYKRV